MKRNPPAAAPAAVRHPALRALLARWSAHRGTALMPSRDDLPFINLLPWRGHVRRVAIEGEDLFRLLPCAHARVEPCSMLLEGDYRRAALTGIPVRTVAGGHEMLVLPFAGPGRRADLLLIGSYAASTEDADERRHQKREQRRAHEDIARRALEKA